MLLKVKHRQCAALSAQGWLLDLEQVLLLLHISNSAVAHSQVLIEQGWVIPVGLVLALKRCNPSTGMLSCKVALRMKKARDCGLWGRERLIGDLRGR